MFSFPANTAPRVAARNANRDDRVLDATRKALGALRDMVSELETLERTIGSDEWADTAEHGSYHRAEYVGRQFNEAAHGLRRFYEASVLATTTAGGYEDEAPGE